MFHSRPYRDKKPERPPDRSSPSDGRPSVRSVYVPPDNRVKDTGFPAVLRSQPSNVPPVLNNTIDQRHSVEVTEQDLNAGRFSFY